MVEEDAVPCVIFKCVKVIHHINVRVMTSLVTWLWQKICLSSLKKQASINSKADNVPWWSLEWVIWKLPVYIFYLKVKVALYGSISQGTGKESVAMAVKGGPLETLVREVIRTADKNTSRVEIWTVWVYEHYPLFHCGSARKALMKRNTSSVVGLIVIALYNTSNTLYKCCSNENFKVVQQTVGRKSSFDNS